MYKLNFTPEQDSYSFREYAASYASTALNGPLSFYSARQVELYVFSCSWVLDQDEYEDFLEFYRARKADQRNFLAPLISRRGSLSNHEVIFLFDTFRYESNAYEMHVVSCDLLGATYEREVVLTSLPYPLAFEESAGADLNLIDGKLQGAPKPVEEASASLLLLGGTLRPLLVTRDVGYDSVQGYAPQLLSGEIRTILKTKDVGFDSAQGYAPQLLSGTIKVILITYSNYPSESAQCGFTLTGGTLA